MEHFHAAVNATAGLNGKEWRGCFVLRLAVVVDLAEGDAGTIRHRDELLPKPW